MSVLSYVPEPQERAYYDALFQMADIQRSGNIGGAQAVAFFARSKLPMEVLKNIWTVADQPSTSSLDRAKFAVAVRLIQLTQNGQKGQGANLTAPPGVVLRPPMFEGVSGVAIPLPPPAGGGGQQQTSSPQMQPQAPPTPMHQQQQRAPPTPSHQQQQQQQQQQRAPPTPSHQQQQRAMQQAPMTPNGRPPHPQQQRPPPQQMMQQQQQQYQQYAPPTPSNRPPPSPASRALVGQDPYSLTPQEQARYDSLFPEYANDGYVYGREAVALFSKSGVSQDVLRAIWNMVDTPVDNRLDKVEFAIAMHLIVCVSKKNLPVPPQGLPMSLKALKSQQMQHSVPSTPQNAPRPEMQSSNIPPMPQLGGGGMQLHQQHQQQQQQQPASYQGDSGIPSPSPQKSTYQAPAGMPSYQHPPQNQGMQGSMQGSMHGQGNFSYDQGQRAVPGPPQVVAAGGMNISDAFEGLSTGPGDDLSSAHGYGGGGEPSTPRSQQRHVMQPAPAPEVHSVQEEKAPSVQEAQPPKTTQSLAAEYNMGTSSEELNKLRVVLQKLQAENISLKAQLGSMTDEEKDVLKELSATVSEIGTLSNSLTSLRAQVLGAKSKLLAASAELKSAQEKKGVLSDLIDQATETKEAIEEVTTSIQMANSDIRAMQEKEKQVLQQNDMFEANLFGFDETKAEGPVSIPDPVAPVVQTASSEDGQEEGFDSGRDNEPETSYPSGPPSQMQNRDDVGFNQAGPAPGMQSGFGSTSLPGTNNYGAPSSQHAQQQMGHQHQPTHHRVASTEFSLNQVMGGTALPPMTGELTTIPSGHSSIADDVDEGIDETRELKNVDELKEQLQQSEETLRLAQEEHRMLMTQTDELRQDADKAEATARSLQAAADEKKKGTFGGGKKKKLQKEAEKARADADEIRKRFMEVQKQANDAQRVVMDTRREVEKLREEAEQAEWDMAAQVSMLERKSSQGNKSNRNQQDQNGYHGENGDSQGNDYAVVYPHDGQSMGNGEPNGGNQHGYSNGTQSGYGTAHQMNPMYGGGLTNWADPVESGFTSGVMGGAGYGMDLPSPNELSMVYPTGSSNYSNPFAG